jgi:glycosyltransferase involved in cell wall biosynthesis
MKILFVGGDFIRKGGQTLIDAYNKFDHSCLELHLVTRADVNISPGVFTYHNLQPNSPELIYLYQHCDVFVLPSLAEAFGIAAVEALACGLPVIAARTGGLTEVVEDGRNGILIPPGDAGALTGAIQYLLDDPERYLEMSRYARVSAENRFDASKNAGKIVSIILNSAGHN